MNKELIKHIEEEIDYITKHFLEPKSNKFNYNAKIESEFDEGFSMCMDIFGSMLIKRRSQLEEQLKEEFAKGEKDEQN